MICLHLWTLTRDFAINQLRLLPFRKMRLLGYSLDTSNFSPTRDMFAESPLGEVPGTVQLYLGYEIRSIPSQPFVIYLPS